MVEDKTLGEHAVSTRDVVEIACETIEDFGGQATIRQIDAAVAAFIGIPRLTLRLKQHVQAKVNTCHSREGFIHPADRINYPGLWRTTPSGKADVRRRIAESLPEESRDALDVLRYAKSLNEIRASIASFKVGADPSYFQAEARKLYGSSEYWVYDPTYDAFCPAKFAAFAHMTYPRYEEQRRNQANGEKHPLFDGGRTSNHLEDYFDADFTAAPLLAEKLSLWAQEVLGRTSSANPTKWKFLIVKDHRAAGEVQANRPVQFWWVAQEHSFNDENHGAFLWAPIESGKDESLAKDLRKVRPGDIIVTHSEGDIVGLARVVAPPYKDNQPMAATEGAPDAIENGRRIDVERFDGLPLSRAELAETLVEAFPATQLPLSSPDEEPTNSLLSLPAEAGNFLLKKLAESAPVEVSGLAGEPLPEQATERETLIKSRVGQGQYKEGLTQRWGAKCCITGATVLLRASHIKPWARSSNAERLDPENGFLLTPTYDAAFDNGLISFSPDDGRILFSAQLEEPTISQLGLNPEAQIAQLSERNKSYLEFHLREVFKGAT